jgi:ATP-dependent Clp protease ATP-binding subunit ClpA
MVVPTMERFSDRARRVIEVAQEEARQLDHPYVGTEHLLLGLIVVDGPSQRALVAAGAIADACRAKVAETVGPRGSAQPGDPELSQRARRAVDRASRLSLQRRDPELDPEHLLIGVLDVEGRAGQVLRGVGVDVAALRLAIELPTESVHTAEEPTALQGTSGARAPHCPECGARLDNTAVAYRIIAAEDEQGRRRDFALTSCPACGVVLGTSPA